MQVTVWYSEDRESGHLMAGYDEVSYWHDFETQSQMFQTLATLAENALIGKIEFIYKA